MAAYNKFQDFVEQILKGVHQIHAAGHLCKCMLVNSPAPVATNTVKADLTEIAAGNGYAAGGNDMQNDMTEAGGTATATAVDIVITAGGGSIGPFRYVIAYNDTPAAPVDPLINWWDYGSSITLNDGETFTIDFGASWFTLA